MNEADVQRHQVGEQFSAVESTKARVATTVLVSEPQSGLCLVRVRYMVS